MTTSAPQADHPAAPKTFFHDHDRPPDSHYHAFAYWAGYATDPMYHFDTQEEAHAFVKDPKNIKLYGRMDTIECGRTHGGGRGDCS